MRPLFGSLRGSLRSHLRASSAAVGTVALAATILASPASARPAIILTPGDLPRGADVSAPHLEGRTIVDGALRLKVKAPMLRLLGKSGAAYVVGTANAQGAKGRIYRVALDGTRTLVAKAHPFMSILSADGGTLVTTKVGRTDASTVTVYDVATATRK